MSLAGANRILDLQTNFGEMANPALNSAPAAFSPQFTKKSYRTAGSSGSKNSSNSSGGAGAMQTCSDDADGAEKGLRSEVSPLRGASGGDRKNGLSPEKPPKTVFIRSVVDVASPIVVGKQFSCSCVVFLHVAALSYLCCCDYGGYRRGSVAHAG